MTAEHKRLIITFVVGMLAGSVLQLIRGCM